MKKAMTILYKVHDNLYVNLTNKCPCSCTFCLRQTRDKMDDSHVLWLEHEPDFEEIKAEFAKFNLDEYKEIVFCGFGEPTERLEMLIQVAEWLKKHYNKKIRVNTNGLSDLINGRDTAPEFEGRVDVVSISLNTPNREKYYELTRNKFGIESFDALLKFAENVKTHVSEVVLTTVDTTLTKEEEEQCRHICESLGVTYRIRPWED